LNYGNLEKGHRHYGFTVNGGYAEYVAIHINCLHKLPDNVSFEEGTIVTAAGTALYGMERIGWVQPGETVAVIGPGPIGLMAVQLSKVFGASKVILIGTRNSRLSVGLKMGADVLINIKEEDLYKRINELTNGYGVDLAIEASGSTDGPEQAVKITRKSGRISFIGIYKNMVKMDLNRAVQYNIQMAGGKAEGMWCIERILPLLAQGKIDVKPLITHKFSLDDINEAVKTFKERIGGAIKVVVVP
jgi:L-iditol 2-dehydrogenase